MGFTAGCEGLNSSKSTIMRQINTPGILNICIFVTRAAKIYLFHQKSLIEFLFGEMSLVGHNSSDHAHVVQQTSDLFFLHRLFLFSAQPPLPHHS